MKQEELERMIEAARDYNEPPETPTEEMWAEIRKALPHLGTADDLAARRSAGARRGQRARRWTPWVVGLAAAATLAVGFGLGRLTEHPAVPSETVAAESSPSTPVRLAAAEHMGEAEALLTLFRASDRSGDRAATAEWARELLATTRILLDSRVAQDPEMAALLEDLELVLVQMANAGRAEDNELIEEGIREQQLLTKLRTAAAPANTSM